MLIKRNEHNEWHTPHGSRVKLALAGKEFHIAFDFVEGYEFFFRHSDGRKYKVLVDDHSWVMAIYQTNFGATPERRGKEIEVDTLDIEADQPYGEFFRQVFFTPEVISTQFIEDTEITRLEGINA